MLLIAAVGSFVSGLSENPRPSPFFDLKSGGRIDLTAIVIHAGIALLPPLALYAAIEGVRSWLLRRASRSRELDPDEWREWSRCAFTAGLGVCVVVVLAIVGSAEHAPTRWAGSAPFAMAVTGCIGVAAGTLCDHRLRTNAMAAWGVILALCQWLPMIAVAECLGHRPRACSLVSIMTLLPLALLLVSSLVAREEYPKKRVADQFASGRSQAVLVAGAICVSIFVLFTVCGAWAIERLAPGVANAHPVRTTLIAAVAGLAPATLLATLVVARCNLQYPVGVGKEHRPLASNCAQISIGVAVTAVRTHSATLAVGYLATVIPCIQLSREGPSDHWQWGLASIGGLAIWLPSAIAVISELQRSIHVYLVSGLRSMVGSMSGHLVLVAHGDVGQRLLRDLTRRDMAELGYVASAAALGVLGSGEIVYVLRTVLVVDAKANSFTLVDDSSSPAVGLVDTEVRRADRRVMVVGVAADVNHRESRLFARFDHARQIVCVARDEDAPFNAIGELLMLPSQRFDLVVAVPTAAVLPTILSRIAPESAIRQLYLPDTRAAALAAVVAAGIAADCARGVEPALLVIGSGRPTLFVLDALSREIDREAWRMLSEGKGSSGRGDGQGAGSRIALACPDPEDLGLTSDSRGRSQFRRHFTREQPTTFKSFELRLFRGDASIGSFLEEVLSEVKPTVVVVFDPLINVELKIARVLVGRLNAQTELRPRIVLAAETGRHARTQLLSGALEAYRFRFELGMEGKGVSFPRQFATTYPGLLDRFPKRHERTKAGLLRRVTARWVVSRQVRTSNGRYPSREDPPLVVGDSPRVVSPRSVAIGDPFVDVLDEPSERVQAAVAESRHRHFEGAARGFDMYVCLSVGPGVLAALTAHLAGLTFDRAGSAASSNQRVSLSRTRSRTSRRGRVRTSLYLVGSATLVEVGPGWSPSDGLDHIERAVLRVRTAEREQSRDYQADWRKRLRLDGTEPGAGDAGGAPATIDALRVRDDFGEAVPGTTPGAQAGARRAGTIAAIEHRCPGMLMCPVAASMDDCRARLANVGMVRTARYFVRRPRGGEAQVSALRSERPSAQLIAIADGGDDPGTLAALLAELIFEVPVQDASVRSTSRYEWDLGYVFDATCHEPERTVASFHGTVRRAKGPIQRPAVAPPSDARSAASSLLPLRTSTYGVILRVTFGYSEWAKYAVRLAQFLHSRESALHHADSSIESRWSACEVRVSGVPSDSEGACGLIIVSRDVDVAMPTGGDAGEQTVTTRESAGKSTLRSSVEEFLEFGLCSSHCAEADGPCRLCLELRSALMYAGRGSRDRSASHALDHLKVVQLASFPPPQAVTP